MYKNLFNKVARVSAVLLLSTFFLVACSSGGDGTANNAPIASGVSITDANGGSVVVGDTLTGVYSYADAEGDLEGATTFRWLRSGTAIAGATAASYTLVPADVSTQITFEVIPVATTGITMGSATVSSAITVNSAPIASGVSITDANGGSIVVGDTLTGVYSYADAEGDLEGATTFRWLRSGTAIAGATAASYTLVAADVLTQIAFEVTPTAVTGVATGSAVVAVAVTVLDSTPPVITLSGSNPVSLFQPDPYLEAGASATDNRDGSVSVTITGSVDASIVGSYILTYSATDAAGNTAQVTRTVNVISNDFVTTWKTDNPGVSNSNQVTIGTTGGGYNYRVDWGDGQVDLNVTGDITHTYASAGTYRISIGGDFPQIIFGDNTDAEKLLSIERWGNIQWRSMNRAFAMCINLVGNAADAPDLSLVTDMFRMFQGASAFNQDLSRWDVSAVTNMLEMFRDARVFNQDLSSWDVSGVTDMSGMFRNASAFNQDLSGWDVSSVISMDWMFGNASAFNQDLSGWDVSSVANMAWMFGNASAFNQDLSGWDVSAVTSTSRMFLGADTFNQDLSSWDVSAVTNISRMFFAARAFNQDLSSWDVSSVTNMAWMFGNASAFNQDLSGWDVSSVTSMVWMFYRAGTFNQDLSRWNVASVTDMAGMFDGIALSSANYDALLIGWSAQGLQSNVTFDGGNSRYSSASQAARDTLTLGFGWTVTDGGVVP